jgi:5-methyltetrahydrofolate--homocysteine methyltransferase
MAKDFLKRLANGEVLVSWGPIQTLLQQEKGRSLEGHLAEWIVNHPNDFQDVLKAMYAAGSDIGAAGVQGNNRYRLEAFGLEDRVYELTFKPLQLAREVTPENRYLVGQLGMTGRFLEPVGDMTVDELYKSYEEQIIPTLEAGVDLFGVNENDTDQLVVAIKAVKDYCDLPVIALSLFYPTKRGIRTLMGVDVKTAVARLQEAGADVICATCGGISPIGEALTVIEEMRQGCDQPLMIRPDAGLAQMIDGKIVQLVSPQEMANEVPKWIAAGAQIVGGCCGTSLEHIKAISAAVKAVKDKNNKETSSQ